MNPDTDLKAGDLRLRLIKHVEDPTALRKQYETGEKRTDSEFERLVLSSLTAAGYRVVCQWEVGAFNIDMVVVGNEDRKVALECDGDRYHPPEQLGKDLERQMILERLGWRFIRIRGSEFFRGRENAIKRVIRRLSELGIEPIGPKPSSGDEPVRTEELKARVIRRAEEIRKEWEANPEPINPEPTRKRRWRARTRSEDPAISPSAQPEQQTQAEPKYEFDKKGEQTLLLSEPKPSTERPRGVEEKVVGNGKREAARPVGVKATGDETILDQVCRILKEAKRPLLAREIADTLAKFDITITKQTLNQILWNRNTRKELKHDDSFRWFLG
jgi:very-short-patch-repair endonuclease